MVSIFFNRNWNEEIALSQGDPLPWNRQNKKLASYFRAKC